MYPWMPMKCLELRIEYSSCLQSVSACRPGQWQPGREQTYLASRVDNLRREVLSLIPDLLAERVLDGRVVTFYEMPVHVAHGQRGFSCWESLLVACRASGYLDALAGTGCARLQVLAAFACRYWPRSPAGAGRARQLELAALAVEAGRARPGRAHRARSSKLPRSPGKAGRACY